ncbi:inositol monophosphatase, partial [Kipferlia bialata]
CSGLQCEVLRCSLFYSPHKDRPPPPPPAMQMEVPPRGRCGVKKSDGSICQNYRCYRVPRDPSTRQWFCRPHLQYIFRVLGLDADPRAVEYNEECLRQIRQRLRCDMSEAAVERRRENPQDCVIVPSECVTDPSMIFEGLARAQEDHHGPEIIRVPRVNGSSVLIHMIDLSLFIEHDLTSLKPLFVLAKRDTDRFPTLVRTKACGCPCGMPCLRMCLRTTSKDHAPNNYHHDLSQKSQRMTAITPLDTFRQRLERDLELHESLQDPAFNWSRVQLVTGVPVVLGGQTGAADSDEGQSQWVPTDTPQDYEMETEMETEVASLDPQGDQYQGDEGVVAMLQHRLAEAEAAREVAVAEREVAQAELEDSQAEVATLRTENDALTAERDETRDERDRYRAERDEARAEAQQARAEKEEAQDRSGELLKILESRDKVTVADFRAQKIIADNISDAYPTMYVVGEEDFSVVAGQDVDTTLSVCDVVPVDLGSYAVGDLAVYIDPLDGTKEAVAGGDLRQHVTVLVGVTLRGRPHFGVIHQPYYNKGGSAAGRTVYGVVGHGVFGSVCAAPVSPSLPSPVHLACTRRGITGPMQASIDALSPVEVHRIGGAGYKVLCVIEGSCHVWAYPDSCSYRWDICACEAVLVALGGVLTTHAGTPGVLACMSPAHHTTLCDMLAKFT